MLNISTSRLTLPFVCALSLTACATDADPDVAQTDQADTVYVLDDVQVNVNNGGFVSAPQYTGLAFADVDLGSQEVQVQHFLSGGMGIDATFYHPRKVIQIGCSSIGTQLVNFPQLIDDYYDWAGRLVLQAKTNDAAAITASEFTPVLPPFIPLRKPGVAAQAIRQSPSIGGYVTAQVMTASGMVPYSWIGAVVKVLSWFVEIPEFELETNDWLYMTKLSLAVKFKCKGSTYTPAPTPVWDACPSYSGTNGYLCTCSVGYGSSNTNYCQNSVVGTPCQGMAGPGSSDLVNGTVVSCRLP